MRIYSADMTLLEETVDHGDGTGTRTVWTDGTATVEQLDGLPIPEPDPVELTPEQLAAVTALGLDLIENSTNLTSTVQAIAGANTAKAPLTIIAGAVETGASRTP